MSGIALGSNAVASGLFSTAIGAGSFAMGNLFGGLPPRPLSWAEMRDRLVRSVAERMVVAFPCLWEHNPPRTPAGQYFFFRPPSKEDNLFPSFLSPADRMIRMNPGEIRVEPRTGEAMQRIIRIERQVYSENAMAFAFDIVSK